MLNAEIVKLRVKQLDEMDRLLEELKDSAVITEIEKDLDNCVNAIDDGISALRGALKEYASENGIEI